MYKAVQRRYLDFCRDYAVTCLPLSDSVLCMFVAFLALQGVKHQTSKSYMSALRHMQIEAGLGDPFAGGRFPRLEYVQKGLKRLSSSLPRDQRLPITPSILLQLHAHWTKAPEDPDSRMLWAACCLGFFGFLRSGEFTVHSDNPVDPSSTLMPADVAVDSRDNPQTICVHIKQSKTDPFRSGVHLYLGRTGHVLCPVASVLGYLAARPNRAGPLFIFNDGRYLTRQRLVQSLRLALRHCGIDPRRYSGHSFRIGAASAAARAGVEDSVIRMLGRWESAAFLRYIRTPREQLAAVSARIANVQL